jgi:hypothetical protein
VGAKTALLIAAGGDIPSALRQPSAADPVRTEALVGHAFPGYAVSPADGTELTGSSAR